MAQRNLHAFCIRCLTYFIVLLSLLHEIKGFTLEKHMEVDEIEHSCPQLNTCNYGNDSVFLSSEIEKSCACDIACNRFEDCCIDAPKLNGDKSDMSCHEVKGLGGVYMVGKCPAIYDGDENWKEQCENMEVPDPSDPLGSVPVTDPETGVTYKNVYCKRCNGKLDLMNFWKTKVDCPFLSSFNESHSITDKYVLKNLVKKEEVWGLDLKTMDGMFFLECNIEAVIPSDLQKKIRRCTPNLKSDCLPSWENKIISEKCKSFQGPRYTSDGYGYRNIYCAICNNVNAADLSCLSPQAESMKIFRFSVMHSFAVLLDINSKEGERVGMIKMCKSGEVYDPFFKKCRELQCLPGFVRRRRKCLPRRSVIKNNRKPVKYQRVFLTTTKPRLNIRSQVSSTSVKIVSYTKKQSSVSVSLYERNLYSTSVYPLTSEAPPYVYDSSNVTASEEIILLAAGITAQN